MPHTIVVLLRSRQRPLVRIQIRIRRRGRRLLVAIQVRRRGRRLLVAIQVRNQVRLETLHTKAPLLAFLRQSSGPRLLLLLAIQLRHQVRLEVPKPVILVVPVEVAAGLGLINACIPTHGV